MWPRASPCPATWFSVWVWDPLLSASLQSTEDRWRCTSPLWGKGKDGLGSPSTTLSQSRWSPRSAGHLGEWKPL